MLLLKIYGALSAQAGVSRLCRFATWLHVVSALTLFGAWSVVKGATMDVESLPIDIHYNKLLGERPIDAIHK